MSVIEVAETNPLHFLCSISERILPDSILNSSRSKRTSRITFVSTKTFIAEQAFHHESPQVWWRYPWKFRSSFLLWPPLFRCRVQVWFAWAFFERCFEGLNFLQFLIRKKPSMLNYSISICFHKEFSRTFLRQFGITSMNMKHFNNAFWGEIQIISMNTRNACAHNVCLLCNFSPIPNFRYDVETSMTLLQRNLGIGSGVISSCMKIPLLNDFSVMLEVYTRLVSSQPVKQKTLSELNEFFETRMVSHKDYFSEISGVKNAYNFAHTLLKWHMVK